LKQKPLAEQFASIAVAIAKPAVSAIVRAIGRIRR
jgi:hypothetical protein